MICLFRIPYFFALIVLGIVIGGCATYQETEAYKLYSGPIRSSTEISILQLYDASKAVIDGMSVSHSDYTEVHLSPGVHNITWTSVHGMSVLVEASGFALKHSEQNPILLKGRIYRLRSARTTGHEYTIYNWIEDLATGEVIAGTAKP